MKNNNDQSGGGFGSVVALGPIDHNFKEKREALKCSATLATMLEPVRGKFATFDAGETVKVIWRGKNTCMIERQKWDGSRVPIMHQLGGVPSNLLRFLHNAVVTHAETSSRTHGESRPR